MTSNNKGFSLIEILIGITLLALIGGVVANSVFKSLYEGQMNTAIVQMQSLKSALNNYRRHCNRYPTTEQGLEALISKPEECKRYQPGGYLEGGEVPLDPWDWEYFYESDGRTITLKSLGKDGTEGGEGEDKDIPLDAKESSEG